MGLMDKYVAHYTKNSPPPPDFPAVLAHLLPPGDTYLAHVLGSPQVGQGKTATGVGYGHARLEGYLTNVAVKAVKNAVHTGGGSDSIAKTRPPQLGYGALTISTQSFSVFSYDYTTAALTPLWSLPRSNVRSVVRTGSQRGGRASLRITYADDSYVDYHVQDHGAEPFWAACAGLAG